MAVPYGFKKMADGNVRMVAPEIEVVQRIYRRYVDGASLGALQPSWKRIKLFPLLVTLSGLALSLIKF